MFHSLKKDGAASVNCLSLNTTKKSNRVVGPVNKAVEFSSRKWWPIDEWNELIFILTSFVLVLTPPLVPSGSNSKVVQIRIRILCAIEEIWNFLFIYRKKSTRWWPWPHLTSKFNRKSFKEIQISWVGSGNKWPSEILPTPNLAKNNCHEIKQINLF